MKNQVTVLPQQLILNESCSPQSAEACASS